MTDYYQPLFDHMQNVYGLVLYESDLTEIIEIVERMNEKAAESIRVVCDVLGCNETSVSGSWYANVGIGLGYGYYCFCSKHIHSDSLILVIKQSAIDREKTRRPDGTLP